MVPVLIRHPGPALAAHLGATSRQEQWNEGGVSGQGIRGEWQKRSQNGRAYSPAGPHRTQRATRCAIATPATRQVPAATQSQGLYVTVAPLTGGLMLTSSSGSSGCTTNQSTSPSAKPPRLTVANPRTRWTVWAAVAGCVRGAMCCTGSSARLAMRQGQRCMPRLAPARIVHRGAARLRCAENTVLPAACRRDLPHGGTRRQARVAFKGSSTVACCAGPPTPRSARGSSR